LRPKGRERERLARGGAGPRARARSSAARALLSANARISGLLIAAPLTPSKARSTAAPAFLSDSVRDVVLFRPPLPFVPFLDFFYLAELSSSSS